MTTRATKPRSSKRTPRDGGAPKTATAPLLTFEQAAARAEAAESDLQAAMARLFAEQDSMVKATSGGELDAVAERISVAHAAFEDARARFRAAKVDLEAARARDHAADPDKVRRERATRAGELRALSAVWTHHKPDVTPQSTPGMLVRPDTREVQLPAEAASFHVNERVALPEDLRSLWGWFVTRHIPGSAERALAPVTEPAVWVEPVLTMGAAAVRDVAADLLEAEALEGQQNPFAVVARSIERAFKRRVLADYIERCHGDLQAVATRLQLGSNSSATARLVRELGLEEHLAAVRARHAPTG